MINKDRIQELTNAADEAMADAIRKIPDMIHNGVRSAIPRMFGFRDRWQGEWEVDHCNSRTSDVSRWINNEAEKEFKKQCDRIITKKFIREMLSPEFKQAVRKDFKERFLRNFEWKLKELVEEKATEEAKKITDLFDMKSIATEMEAIAQEAMGGGELTATQEAIMERGIEDDLSQK